MTELQKTLIIVTGRDKTAAMIASEVAENKHARRYFDFLMSMFAHCLEIDKKMVLDSANAKYDNDDRAIPARYFVGSLVLLAGYRNKFEDLEKYMDELSGGKNGTQKKD